VTYAAYYLARLNLSMALPEISRDLGYSRFMLGLIGGAFSISYAVGQFVNGQLAETFGARRLASLGLVLSALMSGLFGYSEAFIALLVIWGFNGYFQSMGWPSVVKIVRGWFGLGRLGLVGGLFGSCFLVGNIAAWSILGYVTASQGWRSAFLTPIIPLLLLAALFYLGVKDRPRDCTTEDTRCKEKDKPSKSLSNVVDGLRRIMLSKRIIMIATAYTLLQFVRSGFTLWAPSYVLENYGLSLDTAGYGASAIPLGGILGSVAAGWLSERLKSLGRGFGRTPSMILMTVCLSMVMAALYNVTGYGLQAGVVLLFLGGLTLYGPHTLMATVVPMDLEEEYGSAGVAGFIDGVGYLGLTFADPFIGWIVDTHGWDGAVTFWLASALGSTLLLGLLMLRGETRR